MPKSNKQSDYHPYADAVQRGKHARFRMLRTRGGCLPGSAVAELLNSDNAQVVQSYEIGQLIGVYDEKARGFVFPAWQFDTVRHRVHTTIAAALAVLKGEPGIDDWAILTFFLSRQDRICGKAPIDLLDSRNEKRILTLAREFAR